MSNNEKKNLIINKWIWILLERVILIVFLVIFLEIILLSNFVDTKSEQFSELANSFIHGKLYFLDSSPYNNKNFFDNVFLNNYCYWPLGPLPAVILMPFVFLANIFGFYFIQGYLNFLLVLFIFYLIFKIARKLNYTRTESNYWSIAFIFGSMFLGVAMIGSSWYLSQTIVVCLLFLALLEYFNKKRYLLIGLFFGLILLTRVTAFIGILFFIFDILFLQKKDNRASKIKHLLELAVFPGMCFILLCLYNYFRFNNFLDQGYFIQNLPAFWVADRNNYGFFNFRYLARNIYYSLINIPGPVYNSGSHLLVPPFIKPDLWGMSIFATSPYLLYIFFMKIKSKKALILLIASAVVGLLIAPSYFIGWTQFGWRYALDYMPLLFTAFMIIYKDQKDKMGVILKAVVIITVLMNFYLMNQIRHFL